MQETQVLSLRQEDPPEEEMAIPSSILAWEIPWTHEPGGRQSMGSQSRQDLADWAPTKGLFCARTRKMQLLPLQVYSVGSDSCSASYLL